MNIYKKAVSMLTAAAVAVSWLTVSSAAAGESVLTERKAEITEVQQQAIAEFEAQKFSDETTTAKVLCILFSDATLLAGKNTEETEHVTMAHDSDAAKVLDYEFKLFEEAVYEMTHGALKVECTTYWYDEPYLMNNTDYVSLEKRHLAFPPEYDPDNYDFVFGFTGRQGVYGITEPNNILNYGYAHVQIPEIAKELALAEAETPLKEFQKICWTGEVMIHEWMHQVDSKLAIWFHESGYPKCHDYLINAEEDDCVPELIRTEEDVSNPELIKTEEDGIVYLTNPQNGFKWKYEEGKYSGSLVDYYEAFLSGQIIDTKHGNRRVGIFPSFWKAIVKGIDLGNYTVKNAETGNYMYIMNSPDSFLGRDILTISPTGPLPSNIVWDLRTDHIGDWWVNNWPSTLEDPPYMMGGINFLNFRNKWPDIVKAVFPKDADLPEQLSADSLRQQESALLTETKGFLVLPAEDGNCQLQPSLTAQKDTLLCESEDGKVYCIADGNNSTWKIEALKPAEETYLIRYQVSGDVLTGTEADSLMQPFLYGAATGMQTMLLSRNQKGLYTIQTADQELTLTAENGIPQEGSAVRFTKIPAGTSPQLWTLLCLPDGTYQIACAANKNLFLEWNEETGALTLQDLEKTERQQFEIGMPQEAAEFSSPYLQIIAPDGKFLSTNGKTGSGMMRSENGMLWKITELGGGFVKITALDGTDNRVLTLEDARNAEGTQIVLDKDYSQTDARRASQTQSWKIIRQHDGSFRIIPKISFTKGLQMKGDDSLTLSLSSDAASFEIREITLSADGLNKLRDALVTECSMNDLAESYDLNCDGKINAADLTLYKRWMLYGL